MSETIEVQPISYSLTPYTGVWNRTTAAHLLKRTMFGPTRQQITDAVSNGMNATVTSLLQMPSISQPLAYDAAETIVPMGSTWVNAVYPTDPTQAQDVDTTRMISLVAWLMERVNKEQLSIAEKMCLFWQNHFAASLSLDARAGYNYYALIYQYALGNFKQFIKEVTIDPNMLLFLNGATNNVYSPNENYARELLELFSIGKGTQIGSGDYSNYTELDVASGAKILTGYTIDGLRSDSLPSPVATFIPLFHDNSAKQLSYHFGGAQIANNGAQEYSDYIDVIFGQDQVATYICTKLYRYYVNYDLTSDVLTNVIPDMAATMISNNYNILPVMDQLLKSEHFYDVSLRGAILKSPMDMIFSMFNTTNTDFSSLPVSTRYNMYLYKYYFAENLSQAYGNPPSVAGWPAYYQAPSFTKLWVNSTHIKTRFGIGYYVTLYSGILVDGVPIKLDLLNFLNGLSDPYSPTAIIDDVSELFFPKAISAAKKNILKYLLTSGQPDSAWVSAYSAYDADPSNPTAYTPVKNKMELMMYQVFQMPEFQTI